MNTIDHLGYTPVNNRSSLIAYSSYVRSVQRQTKRMKNKVVGPELHLFLGQSEPG